jgi:hypothetical protein
VQKPTQALQSVKGPTNIFDWNPKCVRTLPSLIYVSWYIYRDPPSKILVGPLTDWSAWVGFCTSSPQQSVKYQLWYLNFILWRGVSINIPDINREPPPQNKFKYQSWYLTPYCVLEVQKPTQILQSVKDTDYTFDWNPKWGRTLPSLIYRRFSINIPWKIY